MATVLLTGGTGFIGSHIAEALVLRGFSVVVLKRRQSDTWRLEAVRAQLTFVDLDDEADWQEQVVALQPTIILHAAWLGVSAGQRDDWASQLTNIDFTYQLLALAARLTVRKFIVLGSQAEYGNFAGRIDETAPAVPTTAYGAVKLATLELVRAFCQQHQISWYWLRVFAVFGPREDSHWFVSFVVGQLLRREPLNLTPCQQRYDYSYVADLAQAIATVAEDSGAHSGVYNVSADTALPLEDLVNEVRRLLDPEAPVHFGALPYRPGQVMHMEGDSTKFQTTFGPPRRTPLPAALAETITFVRTRAQQA